MEKHRVNPKDHYSLAPASHAVRCGAGLDDIVKLTTFYVSGGAREDWELSVRERFRHFTGPGPASTGIPVPALAIPGLMIEIEAIAVID